MLVEDVWFEPTNCTKGFCMLLKVHWCNVRSTVLFVTVKKVAFENTILLNLILEKFFLKSNNMFRWLAAWMVIRLFARASMVRELCTMLMVLLISSKLPSSLVVCTSRMVSPSWAALSREYCKSLHGNSTVPQVGWSVPKVKETCIFLHSVSKNKNWHCVTGLVIIIRSAICIIICYQ